MLKGFRTDAKKGGKQSTQTGGSKRRQGGYDPSQERGKDGRWVKTGKGTKKEKESNKNITEQKWSQTARALDRQKGFQAIQASPKKAKEDQSKTKEAADQYSPDKIEENWGVKDKKEIESLVKEQGTLVEAWEKSNPDDPYAIYEKPEYTKIEDRLDELYDKQDSDPLGTRKDGLYQAYNDFKNSSDLSVEPIHAAVINDYMRTGYKDINQASRSPDTIKSEEKRESGKQQVEMLTKSLKEVPNYTGEVHRGTKNTERVDQLDVGDVFKDPGFMSTNRLDRGATPWDLPVQFRIKSKTGKSIREFGHKPYTSEDKTEDEVLFLPNTPFRVTGKKKENKKIYFDLEEY